MEGRIESMTVHGRDLDFSGIRLNLLGGAFSGTATVRDADRYRVEGDAAGFDIRELVALYSRERAPWDGRVAGPVVIQGSARRKDSLTADAQLTISPADAGPPVHGAVAVAYDQRGGTIDLGRSWIQLPSTRVNFSGVLGRTLAVRLESRNLEELVPAIGMFSSNAPKTLPVKLENGTALFDGSVTGPLSDPRISGRVELGRFAFDGLHLDSFQGSVDASRSRLALANGALAQGRLKAQLAGEIALREWKIEDSAALSATAAVQTAPLADLLAAAGQEGRARLPAPSMARRA